MKKIFRLIMLSVMFSLVFSGCDKNVDLLENKFSFNTKYASVETDDGWLIYFSYEYPKQGEDFESYYVYDAVNLKYKYLDGYEVEIIEEGTGEVLNFIKPPTPSFSVNESYGEDIKNISQFFIGKNFVKKITIDDLSGLSLTTIKKQDVVELFNRAIASEPLPNGKYYYLPETACHEEEGFISGYKWHVSYLNLHGCIIKANIELIYEDGKYLSDIVSEGVGTKEQTELHAVIEEIEKKIVSKQMLDLPDSEKSEVSQVNFQRLYNILSEIEKSGDI